MRACTVAPEGDTVLQSSREQWGRLPAVEITRPWQRSCFRVAVGSRTIWSIALAHVLLTTESMYPTRRDCNRALVLLWLLAGCSAASSAPGTGRQSNAHGVEGAWRLIETAVREPAAAWEARPAPQGGLFVRSEERRVGKECRSRWSAEQ